MMSRKLGKFYMLAGHILQTAQQLNITLRWGGDWDHDFDFTDQSFDDLGHYEIVEVT